MHPIVLAINQSLVEKAHIHINTRRDIKRKGNAYAKNELGGNGQRLGKFLESNIKSVCSQS